MSQTLWSESVRILRRSSDLDPLRLSTYNTALIRGFCPHNPGSRRLTNIPIAILIVLSKVT